MVRKAPYSEISGFQTLWGISKAEKAFLLSSVLHQSKGTAPGSKKNCLHQPPSQGLRAFELPRVSKWDAKKSLSPSCSTFAFIMWKRTFQIRSKTSRFCCWKATSTPEIRSAIFPLCLMAAAFCWRELKKRRFKTFISGHFAGWVFAVMLEPPSCIPPQSQLESMPQWGDLRHPSA